MNNPFLKLGTGSKGRLEGRLDGLNMVVAASEAWLEPPKMRVGHWNLQHLPIPAKILRIGGRQLELLVHPARAAALQRLPRACCARAHTALPHCFGECAVLPFKVQK